MKYIIALIELSIVILLPILFTRLYLKLVLWSNLRQKKAIENDKYLQER